jgi:hypothetical protein
MRHVILILLLLSTWIGCGTSKWSDTKRTATEQLLISDAMDRAVSELDLHALAGKKVYLDTDPLKETTDAAYLISTLRQHILASGCLLRDKREEADYIIEVRAGSSGTDNHSLLLGVPQTNLPTTALIPGTAGSTAIPEIPLAKKMEQRAIVKIALFAYNRTSGRPIWQSGLVITNSKAKHHWILGTGPFQQGEIYGGTEFAGKRLSIPLIAPGESNDAQSKLSVADEARFIEPPEAPPSKPKQVAAEPKAPAPPASKSPAAQEKEPPPKEVMAAKHDAPADRPAKSPVYSLEMPPRDEPYRAAPQTPANAPLPSGSPFASPYEYDRSTGLYPSTR